MTDGWEQKDREYMSAALDEARVAMSLNEVPVGAIVVRNGEILSRGHNRSRGDCDPSAHAEIIALRQAGVSVGNHRINGATIYVTLEPCAMCIAAMVQARIARLVFAAYDEKAGAAGSAIDLCNDRHFNHRFEVSGGLMEAESVDLLQTFFTSRRDGGGKSS